MLRGTRPLQNLQPVSDCIRPSGLPFRRSHRFSLLPVALTPLEAKRSSLSTNAVTAALKYEAGIERTWPVLALLDPLGTVNRGKTETGHKRQKSVASRP